MSYIHYDAGDPIQKEWVSEVFHAAEDFIISYLRNQSNYCAFVHSICYEFRTGILIYTMTRY